MQLSKLIPSEQRSKLFKLKLDLQKESKAPEDRWERAILLDKSLLHNLYINVVLEEFKKAEVFDVIKMIQSKISAFSPVEKRKIERMIGDLGIEKTEEFFNSLFSNYKGQLSLRRFRIDEEYLNIKLALYDRFHI